MARRKAAQRFGKQAVRKSVRAPKFPADRLPAELIHMVFTYLKPTEAAGFRWAGRVVAEIGLQYLAPTAYLTLKEESYDRLLAIAGHPTVSKYVVELDYETEGLRPMAREDFDRMIRRTGVIPQRNDSSERPDSCASARAWRAYQRESLRNIPVFNQRQTKQLLNRAWSMYEADYASQKKVQQANFFREKTAKAIEQFPYLERVFTSADGAYERYAAEIKGFLPTYYFSHCSAHRYPSSVGATSSVLLAAESAGLHLDYFRCSINWQVFTQNEKDLATFKRSLLHLKVMIITFTIRRDMRRDRMVQEYTYIRWQCLENGHVLDLITSSPDLEHLALSFETLPEPIFYPTLNETMGNFYWHSLKTVNLESLFSDDDDLLMFCKRHAHTLKDLSLTDMRLHKGSWDVTFHRMRQTFRLGQQLATCKLRGLFWSPERVLDLGPRGEGHNNAAGIVTSDYIRASNIGDISLDEYYEAVGLK
ncbi:hypothetical protein HO133_003814 [Letharia lupina]|uniref:Uncharacterized protein n=1 Tax=Letharia lupina TaxID=560253 RepID=A0A8H6CAQ2_9LECA|nr:uncharacterized protein HO133_003814 [Letharia lupina]KAF6219989.1 hypothetical protein HO133_003814 [Letharia lupina]